MLLAVLNGLCPYLGLKTQATWSMLSNLHVEGGKTNHWLVPASAQVFGYARDCVTVTKATGLPLPPAGGWGGPDAQDHRVCPVRAHHVVLGGLESLRVFRGFAERTGMDVAVHASALLRRSSVGEGAAGETPDVPYCALLGLDEGGGTGRSSAALLGGDAPQLLSLLLSQRSLSRF